MRVGLERGVAGDGPGFGSRIARFDGKTWSTDYSLSQLRVHALWGASANDVYAAVDDGMQARVARWDGAVWRTSPIAESLQAWLPPGVLVRDVWGAQGEAPWIVGDRGFIGRLVPFNGDRLWLRMRVAAPDSPSDPFDDAISYVSVWGAASNDVWAMFVASDGVGFSHWDGSGWRVRQRGVGHPALAPSLAGSLPKGPLRQGRLLGGSGSMLVASQRIVDMPAGSAPGSPELLWDGKTWADAHEYPRSLGPNEDLTTKRAFWSDTSGHLFAAADFGGFLRFDPKLAPMWSGVWQKGARFDLRTVAPLTNDLAYGTELSGRLARWDGSGWYQVSGLGASFSDVHARAPNDVWAVGHADRADGGSDPKFTNGVIAHFDGSKWSTVEIPSADYLTGVWAIAPNDVWAAGTGAPYDWTLPSLVVYHFDGKTWAKVPVPDAMIAVYPSGPGNQWPRVFGLSRDRVYVTGSFVGATPPVPYVLSWNGQALVEIYRGDASLLASGASVPPRLWGTRPDDLWLPASPAIHFDGHAWRPLATTTDRATYAIYGAGPNEVWSVGVGALGGAIRKWDGSSLVTALDTSARLWGMTPTPDGTLWAVGEGGATLRLGKQNAAR